MVVLLDDLALLVAPVEAKLRRQIGAGGEELEATFAEALEHREDAGLDGVDRRLQLEPGGPVVGEELLAVLLLAATGGGVDGALHPGAARLDRRGMHDGKR